MATYNRGFQLGLLPEKKWDWRTFAASYGLLLFIILFLIVFGILESCVEKYSVSALPSVPDFTPSW